MIQSILFTTMIKCTNDNNLCLTVHTYSSSHLKVGIHSLINQGLVLCHPRSATLPPAGGKATASGWQSYHPRVAKPQLFN